MYPKVSTHWLFFLTEYAGLGVPILLSAAGDHDEGLDRATNFSVVPLLHLSLSIMERETMIVWLPRRSGQSITGYLILQKEKK